MVGAMPKNTVGIAARAIEAFKINTNATTKKAAVTAPTIFTKISSAVSKLWGNKGVQVGTGLAASGAGLGFLNSQTQEVTKPLGTFGAGANFGLIVAVIAVIFVLILVMKK